MPSKDSSEPTVGVQDGVYDQPMSTTIWFNQEGKRYFAKLACQNGATRVLEAKTEDGQVVEPSFIEDTAIKAHRRINKWGYIPEPEEANESEEE